MRANDAESNEVKNENEALDSLISQIEEGGVQGVYENMTDEFTIALDNLSKQEDIMEYLDAMLGEEPEQAVKDAIESLIDNSRPQKAPASEIKNEKSIESVQGDPTDFESTFGVPKTIKAQERTNNALQHAKKILKEKNNPEVYQQVVDDALSAATYELAVYEILDSTERRECTGEYIGRRTARLRQLASHAIRRMKEVSSDHPDAPSIDISKNGWVRQELHKALDIGEVNPKINQEKLKEIERFIAKTPNPADHTQENFDQHIEGETSAMEQLDWVQDAEGVWSKKPFKIPENAWARNSETGEFELSEGAQKNEEFMRLKEDPEYAVELRLNRVDYVKNNFSKLPEVVGLNAQVQKMVESFRQKHPQYAGDLLIAASPEPLGGDEYEPPDRARWRIRVNRFKPASQFEQDQRTRIIASEIADYAKIASNGERNVDSRKRLIDLRINGTKKMIKIMKENGTAVSNAKRFQNEQQKLAGLLKERAALDSGENLHPPEGAEKMSSLIKEYGQIDGNLLYFSRPFSSVGTEEFRQKYKQKELEYKQGANAEAGKTEWLKKELGIVEMKRRAQEINAELGELVATMRDGRNVDPALAARIEAVGGFEAKGEIEVVDAGDIISYINPKDPRFGQYAAFANDQYGIPRRILGRGNLDNVEEAIIENIIYGGPERAEELAKQERHQSFQSFKLARSEHADRRLQMLHIEKEALARELISEREGREVTRPLSQDEIDREVRVLRDAQKMPWDKEEFEAVKARIGIKVRAYEASLELHRELMEREAKGETLNPELTKSEVARVIAERGLPETAAEEMMENMRIIHARPSEESHVDLSEGLKVNHPTHQLTINVKNALAKRETRGEEITKEMVDEEMDKLDVPEELRGDIRYLLYALRDIEDLDEQHKEHLKNKIRQETYSIDGELSLRWGAAPTAKTMFRNEFGKAGVPICSPLQVGGMKELNPFRDADLLSDSETAFALPIGMPSMEVGILIVSGDTEPQKVALYTMQNNPLDNPVNHKKFLEKDEDFSIVEMFEEQATPVAQSTSGDMTEILQAATALWEKSPYSDMPPAHLDFY